MRLWMCVLGVVACGGDKPGGGGGGGGGGGDDTAVDTGPDTSAPPAEPLVGLAAGADDAALLAQRWFQVRLTGLVDVTRAEFSVASQEGWAGEAAACSATVTAVGAPMSTTDCNGCDWAHRFGATIGTAEGDCTFAEPLTSFQPTADTMELQIRHYADWTDPFGSGDYAERLQVGWVNGAANSWVLPYNEPEGQAPTATGWVPSTGVLDFIYGTGLELPRAWSVCEDAGAAPVEVAALSALTAASGSVACGAPARVDHHILPLAAGQAVRVGVDVANPGMDPGLALVGPEGCLRGQVAGAAPCSSGDALCPAVAFTADTAGDYTLVVTVDGCGGAAMAYSVVGEQG
jgi:hypothetical protein